MKKSAWLTKRRLLLGVVTTLIIVAGTIATIKNGTGFGDDITTSEERDSRDQLVKKVITNNGGKTLWDGLELFGTLALPVLLVILANRFQEQQQKQADEEAKEEALQAYFDRLSTLLVDKNLIAIAKKVKNTSLVDKLSAEDKELLKVAEDIIQARTISILRRLREDKERKTDIILFLIETEVLSTLNLNTSKFDLKSFDLEGVNLQRANLKKASLEGINLKGASLKEADLEETNFEGANLEEANFGGANIHKAILKGANLRASIFYKIMLDYDSDTFYNSTNLSESNLQEAKLQEADLRGTDLSNAKLIKAKLEGAKLSGIFEYEESIEEDVSRACTQWLPARLKNATLHGASLKEAILERGDLEETNLQEVDFEGANLRDAQLNNADLRNAKLNNADLCGADLRFVKNWSEEQLSSAKLCYTKLPTSCQLNRNRDCTELGISTD